MENKIKKLDKKYNALARKLIYGKMSDTEYENAIEKLQALELEIIKLRLIK